MVEYRYASVNAAGPIFIASLDQELKEVSSPAGYVSCYSINENLTVTYTADLSEADKTALDTLVANDDGICTEEVFRQKDEVNNATIIGAAQELKGSVLNPAKVDGVINVSQLYVVIVGKVNVTWVSGDKPKLRMDEETGGTVVVMGELELGDTNGTWREFTMITGKLVHTQGHSGRCEYILYGDLNGATLFQIRSVTRILYETRLLS